VLTQDKGHPPLLTSGVVVRGTSFSLENKWNYRPYSKNAGCERPPTKKSVEELRNKCGTRPTL